MSEQKAHRTSYINMMLYTVLNDFLEDDAIAAAHGEDYRQVMSALEIPVPGNNEWKNTLEEPLFAALESLVEKGLIDQRRCDYAKVVWLLDEARKTRSEEIETGVKRSQPHSQQLSDSSLPKPR